MAEELSLEEQQQAQIAELQLQVRGMKYELGRLQGRADREDRLQKYKLCMLMGALIGLLAATVV